MKHRCRLASPHSPYRWTLSNPLATFALVVLTVCFSSPALAQRLASLNPAIKTAVDAKPHADEIKAFVKGQVDALKNDKAPEQQQRAREALGKEAGAAGVTPSPSYLDLYATTVNDQLLPLASEKISVRTRLNAAIALQKVAKGTSSAKLAPVATKFAQDPCVGVALWAIKASDSIVQALATAGKPDKLTGAIV